ncbi:ADP-glyceromanno-heptose 6-epimerase [Desulfurobacterium atlanticum]|uniref:ADP-L-glycero-D-manno-heptose-6-epimerase n=1 Tax=Desulfurobacterium atlanticum TaxID=240169 RepID=A0A238XQ97_9BACT|nr:ADP-glyceromanno-heptose 6-epimerase [Desulfurobacterium atlanticum]SNR60758.1 ADP-glyceromanno-heptose 6-epimerase precursor [Desulfurobacterium atlanticum]
MIIVTGGAGFIGSNIVKELNEKGIDEILIVDNLENSEKHRNLNRLEFLDFIDKRDFIENLSKFQGLNIEVIFHQGACSNTMEYDGRYMMENNYAYSKKLLHFAMDNKIRFIYASSASVYGTGKNGFREVKGCEYPLNIYAFSKFLFDHYVRRIINNVEVQIVGLRYFNVYGPQENHKEKMASVVFHFHNQILKEGKVKLFEGSENFKRDFIYVKDVVNVNMFFFENPDKKGIFNCGTGKARSFLDIAKIMQRLYDKDVKIEFIPFSEQLKGKYQTFTEADLTNLKKTGYEKSFTELEIGVKDYVQTLKRSGGYL